MVGLRKKDEDQSNKLMDRRDSGEEEEMTFFLSFFSEADDFEHTFSFDLLWPTSTHSLALLLLIHSSIRSFVGRRRPTPTPRQDFCRRAMFFPSLLPSSHRDTHTHLLYSLLENAPQGIYTLLTYFLTCYETNE